MLNEIERRERRWVSSEAKKERRLDETHSSSATPTGLPKTEEEKLVSLSLASLKAADGTH